MCQTSSDVVPRWEEDPRCARERSRGGVQRTPAEHTRTFVRTVALTFPAASCCSDITPWRLDHAIEARFGVVLQNLTSGLPKGFALGARNSKARGCPLTFC